MSKFIGENEDGTLIFNRHHKDFVICDTCKTKSNFDTTDDHYCGKCYTCEDCPHDERKHKRWRKKHPHLIDYFFEGLFR